MTIRSRNFVEIIFRRPRTGDVVAVVEHGMSVHDLHAEQIRGIDDPYPIPEGMRLIYREAAFLRQCGEILQSHGEKSIPLREQIFRHAVDKKIVGRLVEPHFETEKNPESGSPDRFLRPPEMFQVRLSEIGMSLLFPDFRAAPEKMIGQRETVKPGLAVKRNEFRDGNLSAGREITAVDMHVYFHDPFPVF